MYDIARYIRSSVSVVWLERIRRSFAVFLTFSIGLKGWVRWSFDDYVIKALYDYPMSRIDYVFPILNEFPAAYLCNAISYLQL